ncbi:hypothetical protein AK812_SmicGene45397 [Symbiodinium microadriaticum]|uniref:Uncharacterized protein n=1 Tax=Symbiodinium microadriaticum TaxID=2951 RepID=A0A1Q9BW34_SYMMI|nr:hypothetical protein AK812_SmicGene45397 [Symbiodinium microadriaticum]
MANTLLRRSLYGLMTVYPWTARVKAKAMALLLKTSGQLFAFTVLSRRRAARRKRSRGSKDDDYPPGDIVGTGLLYLVPGSAGSSGLEEELLAAILWGEFSNNHIFDHDEMVSYDTQRIHCRNDQPLVARYVPSFDLTRLAEFSWSNAPSHSPRWEHHQSEATMMTVLVDMPEGPRPAQKDRDMEEMSNIKDASPTDGALQTSVPIKVTREIEAAVEAAAAAMVDKGDDAPVMEEPKQEEEEEEEAKDDDEVTDEEIEGAS